MWSAWGDLAASDQPPQVGKRHQAAIVITKWALICPPRSPAIVDRLPITAALSLDPAELEVSFIRASGPGGQNVNKVATAVQLRFDLGNSPSLPAGVKSRAARLAGTRLTTEGVVVITADRHRTQAMNRDDAVMRLLELLRAAATPPKPRRPTRPTLASKQRRLKAKAERSGVKRLRTGRPDLGD